MRLLYLWFALFAALALPAQNETSTTTQLTFVKGERGFIIDSISVQTSRMTRPTGHRLRNSAVTFDQTIVAPVDYLVVRAFAGGVPLGGTRLWVDGPDAWVQLNVDAGRVYATAVRGSGVETWYRGQLDTIATLMQVAPELVPTRLLDLIYLTSNELIVTDFITLLVESNPRNVDAANLAGGALYGQPKQVRDHPDMVRLANHLSQIYQRKRVRIRQMNLYDRAGQRMKLKQPDVPHLIVFRTDGCPVCDQEAASLNQDRATGGIKLDRPVFYITVTEPGGSPPPLPAASTDGVLQHYREPYDAESYSRGLGVLTPPQYYLVNRYGDVAGRFSSYAQLRQHLGPATPDGE